MYGSVKVKRRVGRGRRGDACLYRAGKAPKSNTKLQSHAKGGGATKGGKREDRGQGIAGVRMRGTGTMRTK